MHPLLCTWFSRLQTNTFLSIFPCTPLFAPLRFSLVPFNAASTPLPSFLSRPLVGAPSPKQPLQPNNYITNIWHLLTKNEKKLKKLSIYYLFVGVFLDGESFQVVILHFCHRWAQKGERRRRGRMNADADGADSCLWRRLEMNDSGRLFICFIRLLFFYGDERCRTRTTDRRRADEERWGAHLPFIALEMIVNYE